MINPVLITESSIHFKKGQIIEKYNLTDDGIEIEENYVPKGAYIVLTENLSKDDEKKIREIVRETFKKFFWNLYTKQNIMIGG